MEPTSADAGPTTTDADPTTVDADPATATATAGGRPVIESRRRRLSAYLQHNGERICRDAIALGSWALAMTIWYQWAGPGFSRWMYYTVTFVGVVGYVQVTSPWSRPYRSPDDLEFEGNGVKRRSEESQQRYE